MLTTNIQLSLISIILAMILTIFFVFLSPIRRKLQHHLNNKNSNINAYISESINGVRITQSFNREEKNESILQELYEFIFGKVTLDELKSTFETSNISEIMRILEVPTIISDKIIKDSNFEENSDFNKWTFSQELGSDSEVSSPIMKNNLNDLNQIVAIVTLLKALNVKIHGATGLHINIGVDYLECNEKSIENLLKIWEECEELFFKIANQKGIEMREIASDMATPIKENIQNFFETDGSVTLNTEDDIEKFLYQIQARNRMNKIIEMSGFELKDDLNSAETEEEKFNVYHRYNEILKEKNDTNSQVRFTSMNFNHIKWNSDSPGRIEIRIFNSSIEPEIIFQNLLLVGKLFEVSLMNAKDPNYKKAEFEKMSLHNVEEEIKLKNLLDLLFDKEEQRQIFIDRWKSINRELYNSYISGEDTFLR